MALPDAQLQELYKTGTKYRKELLAMPLVQLSRSLEHMTLRVGIRGKETVGELQTDAELRPYKSEKGAVDNTSIVLRELETYLGDVVKEFDPHLIAGTVYGNAISTKPENFNLIKAIAMEMAKVASNNLHINLFTAVRKSAGDKTKDLFDGFSTIISKDIASGSIASNKGNFAELGEMNQQNIVDKLMMCYQDATCDELKDQKTKLFLPYNLYTLYTRGYQDEFGQAPFNTQYKKTYLEGSDQLCELVPMSGMKGTGQIIFTPKSNMLIGVDQMSDSETVEIRRPDNPKAVQFFMKLFFGVQLESISKQRLLVGTYTEPVI